MNSQAGWHSDLPEFHSTSAGIIQTSLAAFVQDVSASQATAWREGVPLLQKEAGELLQQRVQANRYGAILEYRLPYDERRPDALLLAEGAVVVMELKGKLSPDQADLDQVAAYARDLRAYHRECHNREVLPVLVPTRAKGTVSEVDGVLIVAPDRLDQIVGEIAQKSGGEGPALDAFLHEDSYCPLPTLVQAARELFESRTIREIWTAKAVTDPAVEALTSIAHEAAQTKSRHLVLVTGVPGSGKTLVGMRTVHAKFLDDLAVPRKDGKPSVPGLYLTGNGPLAEVLQYEFRRAGGGGRTFVRHIKSYLDMYVPREGKIPPEHLLVFDEAQRAFNPERVKAIHNNWPAHIIASEPELFIQVCNRMPEWSVLVGLIGEGQEIHIGEEDGLIQWRDALERSSQPWTVHAPPELIGTFGGASIPVRWYPVLNLDTEIRFHRSTGLHELVENLLVKNDAISTARIAKEATAPYGRKTDGMKLYITRDLGAAKDYLRNRYGEDPHARYGLLASSRDKHLAAHGIDNTYQATSRMRIGPWFSEGENHPESCRQLSQVVTEFGCQGLELEMAIVGWGTDLLRENGQWTNKHARGYANGPVKPVDPFQMRLNAYRVLLTRGRDGTIVFVPNIPALNETYVYLVESGFQVL